MNDIKKLVKTDMDWLLINHKNMSAVDIKNFMEVLIDYSYKIGYNHGQSEMLKEQIKGLKK